MEMRPVLECVKEDSDRHSNIFKRVSSAILYGVISFTMMVVNKTVLTTYKFPSFQVLAIAQMLVTIIVLFVAKTLKIINYPGLSGSTFCKIWPLPVIYLGNVIFGLGSTKELSLPMFTALRRFVVFMTMVAEFYILGVRPTLSVQISVYTMIIGAIIAVSDDLAFKPYGYILVLLYNLCSAMNGVYIKKKLDSNELGTFGLMYYNSLFMLIPALIIAYNTDDLMLAYKYIGWQNIYFIVQFLLSCVLCTLLSYSIIVCTLFNSALTTTIIGCLRDICITYVGIIIGGDYIFSLINFVGLNLSIIGSLVYTYVTFRKENSSIYMLLDNENSDEIEVVECNEATENSLKMPLIHS